MSGRLSDKQKKAQERREDIVAAARTYLEWWNKKTAEEERKPKIQEEVKVDQTKTTESYWNWGYGPIIGTNQKPSGETKSRKDSTISTANLNDATTEAAISVGTTNADSWSSKVLTAKDLGVSRAISRNKEAHPHTALDELLQAASKLAETCIFLDEIGSASKIKAVNEAVRVAMLSSQAFVRATDGLAAWSTSSISNGGRRELTQDERLHFSIFLDKVELLLVQYKKFNLFATATAEEPMRASAYSQSPIERLKTAIASALSAAAVYVKAMTRNICFRSDILDAAFALAENVAWSAESEN